MTPRVLRAGAAGILFDDTRAPSTIGSWLRAHKWSNVRQHDAVSRELLARLWAAGAGPADLSGAVDDRPGLLDRAGVRPRQAGRRVRLHQGPRLPPAVRDLRRRPGWCCSAGCGAASAGAARGAKSFLTETVSRVRSAGATGQLTVRADSAFYSRAVLGTGGQARRPVLGHGPAGQEDPGRDRGHRRERLAADPVLAVHPGGLRRRRRRDQLHRVLPARTRMTVRLIVRRVRPTPG